MAEANEQERTPVPEEGQSDASESNEQVASQATDNEVQAAQSDTETEGVSKRFGRARRGRGRGRRQKRRQAEFVGSMRSEMDRRTSYVRRFYACRTCGVKIPKKGAVARGPIRCYLCGQYMVEAE